MDLCLWPAVQQQQQQRHQDTDSEEPDFLSSSNSEVDEKEIQEALMEIERMNTNEVQRPTLSLDELPRVCHVMKNTEYDGNSVIKWGADHFQVRVLSCRVRASSYFSSARPCPPHHHRHSLSLQESAGDCCDSCQHYPDCNIWVWCGNPDGCGGGRKYKECWLKKGDLKTVLDGQGSRTSGEECGVAWCLHGIAEIPRNRPSHPLVYRCGLDFRCHLQRS